MAVDVNLVKKPYRQERYTESQIQEITKCINDPKYFLQTHCYIQHPTKGRMKFDLFDY